MLAPATYSGYNEKGMCIVTRTAQDANEFINPSEVQAAIETVINCLDVYDNVTNGLKNLINDADKSVVANLKSLGGKTENVMNAISKTVSAMKEEVYEVFDKAYDKHNELQKRFNDDTKNTVRHIEGVVSVR